MPIKGFFPTGIDPMPAPHVQAFLFLPRINSQGSVIFMLDTGADSTTVSLIDVERLNVSYRRLKPSSLIDVSGFGGDQKCFKEDAILIFNDDGGTTCYFPISLCIPKKGRTTKMREQQRRLASVIGRDVIGQCQFNVEYRKGLAELIPPTSASHPTPTRRLI